VIEAPELWGGSFEAKANFGSAAMLLTQVHDSAVLFLVVGYIPEDKPCAKADGSGQSNEATMSTKYDSARGISERIPVRRLALYDHRQLGRHSH
jgi:hypothetical protein